MNSHPICDNNEHCIDCLQVKELKLLYDITTLMNDILDIQKRFEEALKLLKNYLNLQKCVVFKFDEELDELNIFASIDLTSMQQKMGKYKIGEGATGVAAKTKEPIVIENIHNDILFLNKAGSRQKHLISYVAVPLLVENQLLGVLGANLQKDSNLSFEESVKILKIVSTIFAQSMFVYSSFEKEKEKLKEQKSYYKMEFLKTHDYCNIIGKSEKIKTVFKVIDKIAQSKATVLIRGETGTGKELIASAIHQMSLRHEGPFIKLNCAAITETLLESELFGHEKGAFTDAKDTRKGRFELADGGTLFLDEIGDISPSLQVKLLRVLQEKEFERVGGAKSIKVDVRLIAATNRNLEEMVKKGEFREDLFYRLNVIPINLPPLRERGDDVLLLVEHFLKKFNDLHKKNLVITDKAKQILKEYPYPGNIRELENTMERIVLLSDGNVVDEEILNIILPPLKIENNTVILEKIEPKVSNISHDILTKDELEDAEKMAIINALKKHNGIQTKAAIELGITPRQIGYKIKKYDIKSD